MTEFIYAYKELPEDLESNGVAVNDWLDLPEINRILNGQFRFYGNYKRDGEFVSYLKKGNFIKAKTEDGSWQYFEIYNIKKTMTSYAITARHIAFMANKNFIEYCYTDLGNGKQIMNNLQNNLAFKQPFKYSSNVGTMHQFTAKQVKPIDALIGQNNGNQNLVGVTAAELDFDNYEIKLVKQIGADNGYRIDFGVNLEAIEETIDEDYYNSLYLIGGVPENDYDENKEPITYKFLEVQGVSDQNRRIDKRENSNCKTIEELKAWGQTLFDNERIHEPKATHTVSMVALEHTLEYGELYEKIASLHFGDVAHVYVKQLEIDLQERMVEYTWFPTLGKYKSIVLGNDLSMYTSQVKTETQELRQKIDNRTESMVQNVLNATAWITGNSGGHVVFRPEKAPEEILIMDKRDVSTAKRVWRWNLNGLGYSDNGVNGPFGIAMTSNGEIVADFISAGILSGILVQGVALKTLDNKNFQVVVEGGKVSFERKRISTGLNDVHGEKLGEIEATYSAASGEVNGFAVKQIPGYIFSINSAKKSNKNISNPVIQIPANADAENRLINTWAKWTHTGDVKITNEVDISGILTGTVAKFDKIYIGGKEVIPGQNGGGDGDGTGGYPDEITSEADKFAWDLWNYLLANGYSKAAAAGILGNVQGEVGAGMNPDTEQVNGPGYGWVQWDGSAYPLIGSPTWNGREYVQRLIAAAHIKQDYRTSLAQAQLINWCMYNGQWLGKVDPLSVDEFKVINSPKQAAYAFEHNFERPAAAHPERQDYAVAWYDKFKNLKPSTQTGKVGIDHLETLMGQRVGNGQCYAVPAEYSGFMGGCGLGAGTIYGLSHVIGDTSAAADIGEAYDWNAVGWKVIKNPTYNDLKIGAIVNIRRGGQWGSGWAVDQVYGHTGVIYGLDNGRIQTIEQNAEQGQIVSKYDRLYFENSIQSIVIPPK